MRNLDEHDTLRMSIDDEDFLLEDMIFDLARLNINIKPMHVEKDEDPDVNVKAAQKYALRPMDLQLEPEASSEPKATDHKLHSGRARHKLFGGANKASKPAKKKDGEKRKRKGRDMLTHATDGLDIWRFARAESPESHDSSEENKDHDESNRSVKKGRMTRE